MNLLPHKSQQNPVRSLIQNYFAKWLCGDNSWLLLSSPNVKLNLLPHFSQQNAVRSWLKITLHNDFVNNFAKWLCVTDHKHSTDVTTCFMSYQCWHCDKSSLKVCFPCMIFLPWLFINPKASPEKWKNMSFQWRLDQIFLLCTWLFN